jgi:hypothetical protein
VADLWTVKVLAVPDRGAFSSAPGTTIRYGATLHLLGLTGPGASLPEVAPESGGAATGAAPYQITTAPSDRWTVHVRASLAGAESWWESGVHLSLLRAIDERGRKAAIAGDDIEGDGRHRFELQIAPGAKRLDLTFAVVKSRFVEFVVRPSLGYRGQGR